MRYLTLILVTFGLVAAACSPSAPTGTTPSSPATQQPTAAQAATGGTLVWGKQLDMQSSNPPKDGSKQSYEIFRLVYQTLTQPTEEGGVEGELAESWEASSPTTYVFKLRPGVKFSNGRELDASDVVTTLEIYKKDSPLWGRLTLDTFTAVDARTVRFELVRPNGAFPAALMSFFIFPGKEIKDGSFSIDKGFLGTGPFMVKDHVQDVSWTFVKNPHYWRQGHPKVDQLDVKIIKDDAARIAALKSGQIDFAIFDSNDTGRLLQDAPNTKVVVQGTTDYYYLMLNSVWLESKFRDPKVRRAISLALDRQKIIDTALSGVGKPTGFPSIGFSDGCDIASVGAGKQDLEQAKTLLKEAGAENLTFTLTLAPVYGATLGPQMAQVLQQDLAKIGVKMTIAILDGGVWVDGLLKGTHESTLNWFTGGSDASTSLATPFGGSATFSKYLAADPEMLAMVASAQAEPPGPKRTDQMKQFCEKVFERSDFLPIATKPTVIAYRTDRVNPVLLPVEGIQQTFRKIDEFTRVAH